MDRIRLALDGHGVSTPSPGANMVVRLRAPFSLARQHMEFSQFSTFVRSVQFHTCTARCCVLRIGVVSLPANSPGLASLDSIHHRGPLGDSGKHQLRHPKISRSNHQSGLQWGFYSQFHGRYCLLRYWISSGLASWTSTLHHSFCGNGACFTRLRQGQPDAECADAALPD